MLQLSNIQCPSGEDKGEGKKTKSVVKIFCEEKLLTSLLIVNFFLIWKVRNNLFSESIDFKDSMSGRRIFISLYSQNGEKCLFFCSLSSVSFLKVINTAHRSIAEVDF